jgi:hypothetical protein
MVEAFMFAGRGVERELAASWYVLPSVLTGERTVAADPRYCRDRGSALALAIWAFAFEFFRLSLLVEMESFRNAFL